MTSQNEKKNEKQLKPTAILSWKGHPRAPFPGHPPYEDLQVVDFSVQPSIIESAMFYYVLSR